MCVIYSCEQGIVPGDELLELSQERHGDGIGVAWAMPKGKEGVRFRKGLDLPQLKKLLPTIKDKYPVIHFRAASIGGVDPRLTHPFPLIPLASPEMMEGDVPGVLFQNGTWTGWLHILKETMIASGWRVPYAPGDPFSDAWALAAMTERFGELWLKTIMNVESMRVLTWWPKNGRPYKTRWGNWVSKDEQKQELPWWQSQELFLPRKGGKGGKAQTLLPGVGSGKETTATGGSGTDRPANLYYDNLTSKWVEKEDWFQRRELRAKAKAVEGDANSGDWITTAEEPLPAHVYTEEELTDVLCQARGMVNAN